MDDPGQTRKRNGAVALRPPTEARRPYHVGVALGLTAGVYASSLAAVSILQINYDRDLIVDRQPVREAIERLGQHNDEMETHLQQAAMVFEEASSRYAEMAADLQSLHSDVVRLSRKLQAINDLAAVNRSGAGPAVVGAGGGGKLPPVAKSAPKSGGGGSAPPPTQATTGASGRP